MTEVSNTQLEQHYSTNTKINNLPKTVAEGPATLPQHHIFSDRDANIKLSEINSDIYEGSKKYKENNNTSFLKTLVATAIALLAIFGIKKLF